MEQAGINSSTGDKMHITIQPLPHNIEINDTNQVCLIQNENQHLEQNADSGLVSNYPYPPVSTTRKIGENSRSSSESEQIIPEENDFNNSTERPPPQVMTVLGPMPLPPEIRQKIPEKFVAKPIIEEREIYVAKKELQERTIEIPHVQYEHKFAVMPKALKINKFIPNIKEVVKEIPRQIPKAVIEEKVIEVPQGIKYVEVPVEVLCNYPPKIVPKPKIQIVERIVETIKPVVKEKIIEIPQTVIKRVPRVKIIEVPYFVPQYEEKIIEIPYRPPSASQMPYNYTGDLPMSFANGPGYFSMMPNSPQFPASFAGTPAPFTTGPFPVSHCNEIKLPYEAKIEIKVTQNDYGTQQNNNLPKVVAKPIGQINGNSYNGYYSGVEQYNNPGQMYSSDYMERLNISIANMGLNYDTSGGYHFNLSSNNIDPSILPPGVDPSMMPSGFPGKSMNLKVSRGNAPPMMVTCPPEVGKVSFSSYLKQPDILTRQGVIPFNGFKVSGDAQMLFPPLSNHPLVPMAPPPAVPGTPDIKDVNNFNKNSANQNNVKKNEENSGFMNTCINTTCS